MILMTAYGIECIMSPLEEGKLAPMEAYREAVRLLLLQDAQAGVG